MPDTTPTIVTPATATSPATEMKRKTFVPLENNPQIMTTLLHSLGLSPSLALHDVFSLTDPSLLAFVPRPASALLLVFPVSEGYEKYRREEDEGLSEYTGKGFAIDAGEGKLGEEEGGNEGGVLWFRQTIRNSCGLMALLHAAGNGSAREFVDPDSTLGQLLKDATPLPPTERADLLYNSPSLEAAHSASAQQGDTAAPPADDIVELHFVTFVVVNGKLWELDGRRKGPICRGEVGDEDVLGEKALEMGPRRFVGREEGELRFSVVALGPGLD
ncbi:ubiquitinyl hydrolase 1 [Pseudogymnoascus verrucosus]|uniref:Ubiquitin carboxyl-terminal hydrolase n=1 Tax=Pseudogymnoascus verrucosus TaxID=342668 RepID=A0A1B8GWL7_9PEZI|nr:ubiquitinyl hydrolase 1 [Pseudogymnoascus verrucosus]OBU00220.2 ubiquitinyl hydrolase 1 [Pseudogymnoascus verrucosus]